MQHKSKYYVAAMASSTAVAAVPESDDLIIISENNWASQKVLARIAKQLLENMGYRTELVTADSNAQFASMGAGDLHFQMEVWEGCCGASFQKEVDAGRVIDAGSYTALTREEWYYPDYVEEICPGLPKWEALNDCAEKLSTPETAPNARFLAGPADWHPEDLTRVEALDLNVTVVNAGSADALFAELKSAASRKEPILLFNWSPNWVGAAYPGKFIEFPKRDKAKPGEKSKCESDPSWGINKDAIHDCGAAFPAFLKKAMWAGMPDKFPCAAEFIRNIDLTNAQINAAAALVDVDGLDHDKAATAWLESNQSTVAKWIPACAG